MKNNKNKQFLVVLWTYKRRGGSTILDEAWGVVDENGTPGVLESKVSDC